MVLSFACDFRIAIREGSSRYGVSEVQVGVPFPLWAGEICRTATPTAHLNDVMLLGKLYSAEEAHKINLIHHLVAEKDLIPSAIELAKKTTTAQFGAYAITKDILHRESVKNIKKDGSIIDERVEQVLFSDEGWSCLQKSSGKSEK